MPFECSAREGRGFSSVLAGTDIAGPTTAAVGERVAVWPIAAGLESS